MGITIIIIIVMIMLSLCHIIHLRPYHALLHIEMKDESPSSPSVTQAPSPIHTHVTIYNYEDQIRLST